MLFLAPGSGIPGPRDGTCAAERNGGREGPQFSFGCAAAHFITCHRFPNVLVCILLLALMDG